MRGKEGRATEEYRKGRNGPEEKIWEISLSRVREERREPEEGRWARSKEEGGEREVARQRVNCGKHDAEKKTEKKD